MNTRDLNHLKKRLKESRSDLQKIGVLHELIMCIYPTYPEKALPYARRRLKLAEKTGDPELIADAVYDCGTVYINMHEFKVAIEHFTRAREGFQAVANTLMDIRSRLMIATALMRTGNPSSAIVLLEECYQYWVSVDNRNQQGVILFSLGHAFAITGEHTTAVEKLLAALTILEELNDARHVCLCYNVLGDVYASLNDAPMIRQCFLKHLDAAREWGNVREQVAALNNLIIWCNREDQHEEAVAYYKEAERLDPEHHFLSDPLTIISIYRKQGNYRQAIALCRKELNQLIDDNSTNDIIDILILLIELYELAEKPLQALRCCRQLVEYSQIAGNDRSLADAYLCSARLYEARRQYKLAAEYSGKYIGLMDDLNEQAQQRAIAEMQTKFDVETTERENELFRTQNEELTAALDEVRRLNDNLTKVNNEKNEVLGIVAHDLKSPLSGVRMVASLLIDHCERMPLQEMKHQLGAIVDSTERMLSISSALLKAQQIESGDAYSAPELVNVSDVVSRIAEHYRVSAEAKQIGIDVQCDADVELVCSAEALRQAVENVVSNAVKFTPSGRQVYIRVKKSEKKILIEVQDEGPGIGKLEKRKLYGKYSRLSARPTGGESSTGLGLWIAKRAVEALQGRIRCTSVSEGGTMFSVEVPL